MFNKIEKDYKEMKNQREFYKDKYENLKKEMDLEYSTKRILKNADIKIKAL